MSYDSDEDVNILEDNIIEYSNFFKNSIYVDDKLIIYFDNGDNYLCIIQEIYDYKYVELNTDKDIKIILELDENNQIILKTDNYEIIDIIKVVELDDNDLLETHNILLTKYIYPELLIDTVYKDINKYKSTDTEKKQDLISTLIESFNSFDNILEIKKIYNISESFIDIINNINADVDTDKQYKYLYDINNYNKYEKLPKWLIPISNDLKRLYLPLNEITTPIIQDDYIQKNLEEEMIEKNRLMDKNIDQNNYKNIIKILYYNQFQSIQNNTDILLNDGYLLNNYNNNYLRACFGTISGYNTSICTGINGKYIFDERKNYNDLYYPTVIDNKVKFNLLGKSNNINVSGLFIYPENINTITFNIYDDTLSLNEKCLLIKNNYSINTKNQILNKLSNSNKIINVNADIDKDTPKYIKKDYNYIPDNAYHISIKDNINKDDFIKLLHEYIPDINSIIRNYKYKNIYNFIYNYDDFKKIFIKYELNINLLNNKLKSKINNIITSNVNKYEKLYDKYKKKIVINETELEETEEDNISNTKIINLILNYIYKQLNINIKNHYLKKFIESFTRESNNTEDNNWLYNKYNDTKILCKHNLYSCNTLEDPTAYETMMSKYGKPAENGHIHCKVCNEYLDNENFSLLMGFTDDDKPMYNEVIEKEKDEIILDDNENELYKLIELLSNSLGVKLIEIDILKIINIYNLIDHNNLADERYQMNNITTKNHYKIKEAKKNKKQVAKRVQEYIINSNKVIFLFIVILIYIQTATPPYINDSNNNFNLLDLTSNKYKTVNYLNIINKKIVENLLDVIKKLSQKYTDIQLWIDSKEYLDEYNNLDIIKPIDQFINSIKYVLSPLFPDIYERINKYQIYLGISKNIQLIDYWANYKPLPTNNNIIKINSKINDEYGPNYTNIMIKKGSTYNIENVTLIQTIDSYNIVKKYKLLDIYNLNILDNKSFLRIYNYIFSLYGYHNNDDVYFNLLIKRLINTTNDKTYFTNLFKKYNWNESFDKNTIPFIKLREILTNIIDICKNNINCKKSINMFIHDINNNGGYLLLNTKPKRFYKYNIDTILPENEYDDISDKSPIKNIFNKFCYDINKNIILKPKSTKTLLSVYIDIDNSYNICDTDIKPNNENFKLIIEKYYEQNKLPGIYYKKPIFDIDLDETTINKYNKPYNINNRFINYIDSNNIMNDVDMYLNNFKEIYEFTEYYINLSNTTNMSNEDIFKFKSEYENLFSPIIEATYNISSDENDMLNVITKQIMYNKYIDRSLKKNKFYSNESELKSLLLSIILNTEDENNNINKNNKILYHFIKNIILMMSRIKNYNNNGGLGTTFHDYIPKNWKLSDRNKDNLEYFIGNLEFKLHNSIFGKNDKYNGFKTYMDNKEIYKIFTKLFDKIKPYTNKLEELIGIDSKKQIFTEERSNDLMRFIFVYILKNISIFISELEDEIKEINDDGNELYNSLLVESKKNIKSQISIISNFMIDIIINMIQEYIDPSWIISIDNRGLQYLNSKLRQQKEKEKQTLINQLDVMEQDERYITVQLQNYGISNWYKNLSEEASEFINSEEFNNMTEEERIEAQLELIKKNESNFNSMELSSNDSNINLLKNNAMRNNEDSTTKYELSDMGYGEVDKDGIDDGEDDEEPLFGHD